MSQASPNVVERLRQPEYVGENRCVPCSLVNVVIALVVAAGLGVGVQSLAGATPAAVVAAGFLGASLSAIYLRGYLVPGTPTLTRRYLPGRVLRWFDKAPGDVDAPVAGSAGQIEAEPILLEAGAIEFCKNGEDVCATEAFARAWREEIERLRNDGNLAGRMADVLETDAENVEVVFRDSSAMVRNDDHPVARWESRAALLADAAAYPWLSGQVDGWADLDLRDRGQLLNGARVFLERCPECDGEVAFSEDTVESCCREIDVVAMACSDCDALLLEVDV
jgi:hypothetical protein